MTNSILEDARLGWRHTVLDFRPAFLVEPLIHNIEVAQDPHRRHYIDAYDWWPRNDMAARHEILNDPYRRVLANFGTRKGEMAFATAIARAATAEERADAFLDAAIFVGDSNRGRFDKPWNGRERSDMLSALGRALSANTYHHAMRNVWPCSLPRCVAPPNTPFELGEIAGLWTILAFTVAQPVHVFSKDAPQEVRS
jgi:hypothetical protein